jgi:hypothetical protein
MTRFFVDRIVVQLWMELSPSFPLEFWDWWLRGDTVRKGRSCVFPEVSRNLNIGSYGEGRYRCVSGREYNH